MLKFLRRSVQHSAAAGHADHEHHVMPMGHYYKVLGALAALTVITVLVSELGLPMPWSVVAALFVAVIKAGLVVSIFMHLAFDKKIFTLIFLAGCVWMSIFFTLTMVDFFSRDLINPEAGSFYKFDEQMAEYEATGDESKLPGGWVVKNPDAAAHGGHGDDHGAAGHGDDHGAKDNHGAKDDHGDAGDHGAEGH